MAGNGSGPSVKNIRHTIDSSSLYVICVIFEYFKHDLLEHADVSVKILALISVYLFISFFVNVETHADQD